MSDIKISISTGELFDRLSILEIKSQNTKDPEIQEHLARQISELKKISDQVITDDLHSLVKQLGLINQDLWKIEDKLRELEKSLDFGPTFVSLARQVYTKNDLRASIKHQINQRGGNEIRDYKIYSGS